MPAEGDIMKSYTEHKAWQNFTHNVKWLRSHYEFSKEKMAEILGITIGMLKEIENNEVPLDLTAEAILNMGKFFIVKPKDIMGINLENKY